jgi:nitroimidazol reductase NimA-like FMN-containing flavoprotein (pyridoxamine 5'-phosphate oxidase superfamily)
MSEDLGPKEHSQVRRRPEKANYDEDVIFSMVDQARFCNIATVVDGRATLLPTLHAREDRTIYLHGSSSNAMLKAMVKSGEGILSVTHFDGLRLARSGFASSIAYRSAVVMGPVREVLDEKERRRILDLFVDAILPGRNSEVRAIKEREVRLTMVVAMEIEEASAKISEGPTNDEEGDFDLEIWSGVVPAKLIFEEPIASTDGAMAGGNIAVPASVIRLLKENRAIVDE